MSSFFFFRENCMPYSEMEVTCMNRKFKYCLGYVVGYCEGSIARWFKEFKEGFKYEWNRQMEKGFKGLA